MSKWSKIRGPLATIAGAIAAYYTGGLAAGAMGASSSTAASAALTSAGIGAQLGSSVWQNDMAKQQARRQNEAANAAQIAAENRQLKYTEMQNVYNSPVNQMRRLYEAGLNPMLVYGGGNVTGNSSGQYASASAAPVTMANKQMARFDQMAAIANTAMDLQMKEMQLAGMKQQQEAFPLNLAVQLEHAKINNKALALQNAILEHDLNIYKDRKYTTSKDPSWLARLDQWRDKGRNNLQKALHDATYNSDGSVKPWYQFW